MKILLGVIAIYLIILFFRFAKSKRTGENRDVNEQYRLGCLYTDLGKTEKAIKYLKLASEQGHVPSQATLGALYMQLNNLDLAENT